MADWTSPGERRRAERLRLREERSALRLQQGGVRERVREKPQDSIKQWKIEAGPITFFNCAPKHAHTPLVEVIPMEAQAIRNGFVSARQSQGRRASTDGLAIHSGAVYRPDGTILPEFVEREDPKEEHGRKRLRNPPVVEPERLASAREIDGTCVYLGDLKYHFGHFLLETLSRAWYLKDCDRSARFVFHRRADDLEELGSFGHVMLAALGVDRSRLLIASEDMRVKNLIVPSSQYVNTIKGSPGMCVGFDFMRERILGARRSPGRTPEKVYFTRRRIKEAIQAETLAPGIAAAPRRPLLNEHEAEALFARLGYEIISPETLPFEQQVAIVANATHVAGSSGSALHLILFNANPATKLIEIRTKPARNQLIVNAIRGIKGYNIWCLQHREEGRATVLDIDVIERAMKEIG